MIQRLLLVTLLMFAVPARTEVVLPPIKAIRNHLGTPSLSVPVRSKGVLGLHNGFYVLRTKTQMQLVASPTNIPERARRAIDECIAFQTPVEVQGTLLQWKDGLGYDRTEAIRIIIP